MLIIENSPGIFRQADVPNVHGGNTAPVGVVPTIILFTASCMSHHIVYLPRRENTALAVLDKPKKKLDSQRIELLRFMEE